MTIIAVGVSTTTEMYFIIIVVNTSLQLSLTTGIVQM